MSQNGGIIRFYEMEELRADENDGRRRNKRDR